MIDKATVLKYKTEFLAWCNGEEIYVMFSNGGHRFVDSIEDFNSNIKYMILKDSYFVYRKALADGKTIQVQYHHTGCPVQEFVDCNFSALLIDITELSEELLDIVAFRIKPEPQFAVGDWVIVPGNPNFNPTQVTHTSSGVWEQPYYSLWQPTLNEYCWFWDCDNTPILSQFAYIEEDINSTNQFVTINNSMYFNCEPCLALPTVLSRSCKQ